MSGAKRRVFGALGVLAILSAAPGGIYAADRDATFHGRLQVVTSDDFVHGDLPTPTPLRPTREVSRLNSGRRDRRCLAGEVPSPSKAPWTAGRSRLRPAV